METKAQNNSSNITARPDEKRMVENIIRCKWSLSVLAAIRKGINRPGQMERSIDGIATKVLNERLRKLVRFGIVERKVFAKIPPHVEYTLTDFGMRFIVILDSIEQLEEDLERYDRKDI